MELLLRQILLNVEYQNGNSEKVFFMWLLQGWLQAAAVAELPQPSVHDSACSRPLAVLKNIARRRRLLQPSFPATVHVMAVSFD
jgi:hypothetical protein